MTQKDYRWLYEKWVRLTDVDGNVFEGECTYDSEEYCLHEYGREEEALRIDYWLFYFSDIRSVELAEKTDTGVWLSLPEHRMKLEPEAFARMESGQKTIELRLYDEKRRRIKAGDIIRFESTEDDLDILRVKVEGMRFFASFDELYAALPLTACGYTPEEAGTASPRDMDRYYSAEEQRRWGVVGIMVSLL